MSSIGIVAGNGQFPHIAAAEASKKNKQVFIVGIKNEADASLGTYAEAMQWVKLGQMGKLMRFFKKHQVKDIFFAGKITKTSLWKGHVWPDWHAIKMMAPTRDRKDDTLLGAVCTYLNQNGFHVLECGELMSDHMAPEKTITKKKPSKSQLEDIQFGWELAKQMGQLDVGQTVVVKDKAVMAIEAIEGTDEAVLRGGSLCKEGAVIVKVAKPNQDMRFDVPAVGVATLNTMHTAKASVLAIEAGKSLILDYDEFVKTADQLGLIVVGFQSSK